MTSQEIQDVFLQWQFAIVWGVDANFLKAILGIPKKCHLYWTGKTFDLPPGFIFNSR